MEGIDLLDDVDPLVVHRDEIVAVVAADHRWAGRTAGVATQTTDQGYDQGPEGESTSSPFNAPRLLAPSVSIADAPE